MLVCHKHKLSSPDRETMIYIKATHSSTSKFLFLDSTPWNSGDKPPKAPLYSPRWSITKMCHGYNQHRCTHHGWLHSLRWLSLTLRDQNQSRFLFQKKEVRSWLILEILQDCMSGNMQFDIIFFRHTPGSQQYNHSVIAASIKFLISSLSLSVLEQCEPIPNQFKDDRNLTGLTHVPLQLV